MSELREVIGVVVCVTIFVKLSVGVLEVLYCYFLFFPFLHLASYLFSFPFSFARAGFVLMG
jgi:hypothetical protein